MAIARQQIFTLFNVRVGRRVRKRGVSRLIEAMAPINVKWCYVRCLTTCYGLLLGERRERTIKVQSLFRSRLLYGCVSYVGNLVENVLVKERDEEGR